MADLTEQQASLAVKLTGADSTGLETNYLTVDANGFLTLSSHGPVTPGTVASKSDLIGGQYNSSLPTLTTGQQAALQVDANGRMLIGALPTGSNVIGAVTQSGTWLMGNADGTAFTYLSSTVQPIAAVYQDTGPGILSGHSGAVRMTSFRGMHSNLRDSSGNELLGQKAMAASIPIALASDQSAIPVSQSGTWTVQQGTPPWSIVGNVASGATDSGDPVKIGGVYNSTLPTVTTGQRVDLQLDQNGRLLVSSIPAAASKFSFGQLATSTSTAFLAVESTAYTEPTTNSAMTIVSSSANDASAGTGARTVTVTYLDQTGAGPFTTTFTMNGITPVTAGVSNMCFIEKITVATVGSTGSNVGILTLKTGGGTTVGTVAATLNQTLWAHHYVPVSKTCYISGFSFGNNATAAGNGAQFILKASTPTVANTPELQISDFLTLAGATDTDTRSYLSPIQVAGPARVRAYVLPAANAATTQYASFDFIDN